MCTRLLHSWTMKAPQGCVLHFLEVLCGVFMLPAQQVKQLVATPDAAPLLLMHQEAVKRGVIAAAAAAGGQAKLRQTLLRDGTHCSCLALKC